MNFSRGGGGAGGRFKCYFLKRFFFFFFGGGGGKFYTFPGGGGRPTPPHPPFLRPCQAFYIFDISEDIFVIPLYATKLYYTHLSTKLHNSYFITCTPYKPPPCINDNVCISEMSLNIKRIVIRSPMFN